MWMLFAIVITANGYGVMPQGPFATMAECFEAHQYFMETAPKPKINYDAICIQTNVTGDST
tara:strand:+ start:475 stop:657 length:183 start_codon:yes stop_codon:yes gene_type:complete